MTRKDYELIADALRRARVTLTPYETKAERASAETYNSGIATAARFLAEALATTNPRFDRERFLAACGVE